MGPPKCILFSVLLSANYQFVFLRFSTLSKQDSAIISACKCFLTLHAKSVALCLCCCRTTMKVPVLCVGSGKIPTIGQRPPIISYEAHYCQRQGGSLSAPNGHKGPTVWGSYARNRGISKHANILETKMTEIHTCLQDKAEATTLKRDLP